jgi:transcriptional regulator with XRE-family HTH domain
MTAVHRLPSTVYRRSGALRLGVGFRYSGIMGKHEILAKRIRELRQGLGWTQQDLSIESGLSRSYISRLEMGDIALPSNERLRALANALQTSLDDLLQAAGFLDAPAGDNELPDLKTYLRQRYSIYEPGVLQAFETLVRELRK